ncbi:Peptidyl-prolyl cis-trans isomerase A2 [Leucoagaricus sp. SymC.cos]|nr:Peptidyl-prolyl cis-trans isomerase A2 [Leucoagaricus sp. SymC.cos]
MVKRGSYIPPRSPTPPAPSKRNSTTPNGSSRRPALSSPSPPSPPSHSPSPPPSSRTTHSNHSTPTLTPTPTSIDILSYNTPASHSTTSLPSVSTSSTSTSATSGTITKSTFTANTRRRALDSQADENAARRDAKAINPPYKPETIPKSRGVGVRFGSNFGGGVTTKESSSTRWGRLMEAAKTEDSVRAGTKMGPNPGLGGTSGGSKNGNPTTTSTSSLPISIPTTKRKSVQISEPLANGSVIKSSSPPLSSPSPSHSPPSTPPATLLRPAPALKPIARSPLSNSISAPSPSPTETEAPPLPAPVPVLVPDTTTPVTAGIESPVTLSASNSSDSATTAASELKAATITNTTTPAFATTITPTTTPAQLAPSPVPVPVPAPAPSTEPTTTTTTISKSTSAPPLPPNLPTPTNHIHLSRRTYTPPRNTSFLSRLFSFTSSAHPSTTTSSPSGVGTSQQKGKRSELISDITGVFVIDPQLVLPRGLFRAFDDTFVGLSSSGLRGEGRSTYWDESDVGAGAMSGVEERGGLKLKRSRTFDGSSSKRTGVGGGGGRNAEGNSNALTTHSGGGEGGDKKNLKLEVENGGIDVDVHLLPISTTPNLELALKKRTTIDLALLTPAGGERPTSLLKTSYPLVARIHAQDPRPPVHITARTYTPLLVNSPPAPPSTSASTSIPTIPPHPLTPPPPPPVSTQTQTQISSRPPSPTASIHTTHTARSNYTNPTIATAATGQTQTQQRKRPGTLKKRPPTPQRAPTLIPFPFYYPLPDHPSSGNVTPTGGVGEDGHVVPIPPYPLTHAQAQEQSIYDTSTITLTAQQQQQQPYPFTSLSTTSLPPVPHPQTTLFQNNKKEKKKPQKRQTDTSNLTLQIPRSFTGPMTIHVQAGNLDEHIELSEEVKRRCVLVREGRCARGLFVGDFSVLKKGGDGTGSGVGIGGGKEGNVGEREREDGTCTCGDSAGGSGGMEEQERNEVVVGSGNRVVVLGPEPERRVKRKPVIDFSLMNGDSIGIATTRTRSHSIPLTSSSPPPLSTTRMRSQLIPQPLPSPSTSTNPIAFPTTRPSFLDVDPEELLHHHHNQPGGEDGNSGNKPIARSNYTNPTIATAATGQTQTQQRKRPVTLKKRPPTPRAPTLTPFPFYYPLPDHSSGGNVTPAGGVGEDGHVVPIPPYPLAHAQMQEQNIYDTSTITLTAQQQQQPYPFTSATSLPPVPHPQTTLFQNNKKEKKKPQKRQTDTSNLTLQVPRSFTGPMTIHVQAGNLDEHIELSEEVKRNAGGSGGMEEQERNEVVVGSGNRVVVLGPEPERRVKRKPVIDFSLMNGDSIGIATTRTRSHSIPLTSSSPPPLSTTRMRSQLIPQPLPSPSTSTNPIAFPTTRPSFLDVDPEELLHHHHNQPGGEDGNSGNKPIGWKVTKVQNVNGRVRVLSEHSPIMKSPLSRPPPLNVKGGGGRDVSLSPVNGEAVRAESVSVGEGEGIGAVRRLSIDKKVFSSTKGWVNADDGGVTIPVPRSAADWRSPNLSPDLPLHASVDTDGNLGEAEDSSMSSTSSEGEGGGKRGRRMSAPATITLSPSHSTNTTSVFRPGGGKCQRCGATIVVGSTPKRSPSSLAKARRGGGGGGGEKVEQWMGDRIDIAIGRGMVRVLYDDEAVVGESVDGDRCVDGVGSLPISSSFLINQKLVSITEDVFFDITINGLPAGRVIFELFDDIAPKTARNFRELASGQHGFGYKGSKFTWIAPKELIVVGENSTGGQFIYGSTFPAENFLVKHDAPAILSAAMSSSQSTHGLNFCITIATYPKRDGVNIAFGRVIAGMDIIYRINDLNQTFGAPCKSVEIADCGIISLLSKAREPGPRASGLFWEIWKATFGEYPVCLKMARVYKYTDIQSFISAFVRDAIKWRQLIHPNILPFYGIYQLEEQLGGGVCLVSPWMVNGKVIDYLKLDSETPRAPLVIDVLEGLDYLHEHNIVHGNIKSTNVLVTVTGSACLTDFGLKGSLDTLKKRTTIDLALLTPAGGERPTSLLKMSYPLVARIHAQDPRPPIHITASTYTPLLVNSPPAPPSTSASTSIPTIPPHPLTPPPPPPVSTQTQTQIPSRPPSPTASVHTTHTARSNHTNPTIATAATGQTQTQQRKRPGTLKKRPPTPQRAPTLIPFPFYYPLPDHPSSGNVTPTGGVGEDGHVVPIPPYPLTHAQAQEQSIYDTSTITLTAQQQQQQPYPFTSLSTTSLPPVPHPQTTLFQNNKKEKKKPQKRQTDTSNLTLQVPRSFTGPMTIHVQAGNLDEHIELSEEVKRKCVLVREGRCARGLFVGDFSVLRKGGDGTGSGVGIGGGKEGNVGEREREDGTCTCGGGAGRSGGMDEQERNEAVVGSGNRVVVLGPEPDRRVKRKPIIDFSLANGDSIGIATTHTCSHSTPPTCSSPPPPLSTTHMRSQLIPQPLPSPPPPTSPIAFPTTRPSFLDVDPEELLHHHHNQTGGEDGNGGSKPIGWKVTKVQNVNGRVRVLSEHSPIMKSPLLRPPPLNVKGSDGRDVSLSSVNGEAVGAEGVGVGEGEGIGAVRRLSIDKKVFSSTKGWVNVDDGGVTILVLRSGADWRSPTSSSDLPLHASVDADGNLGEAEDSSMSKDVFVRVPAISRTRANAPKFLPQGHPHHACTQVAGPHVTKRYRHTTVYGTAPGTAPFKVFSSTKGWVNVGDGGVTIPVPLSAADWRSPTSSLDLPLHASVDTDGNLGEAEDSSMSSTSSGREGGGKRGRRMSALATITFSPSHSTNTASVLRPGGGKCQRCGATIVVGSTPKRSPSALAKARRGGGGGGGGEKVEQWMGDRIDIAIGRGMVRVLYDDEAVVGEGVDGDVGRSGQKERKEGRGSGNGKRRWWKFGKR